MTVPKIGKYRWTIVALLFFSTTINYMDRQVIGYLKPILSDKYGWSNSDFALITAWFTGIYASVTVFAGAVIDKIGTKLGLALSLSFWSIMGMLNALCSGAVYQHVIVRSLFGIGEAGNFPASIKTVAEWFPKKERALATGIFNSGANVGAMIAALLVPYLAAHTWLNGYVEGWQMAFLFTGTIGLVWLIFWFAFYNKPSQQKRLSVSEYKYIHSDDATSLMSTGLINYKISWLQLLTYRQTWSFFIGKFLTDGVWWFLLFWLPDYMQKQFNMEGEAIMLPLFTVYGVAIIGSVAGGGFPMYFIHKGMETYKARMKAMLIIALLPIILITTQYFGNVAVFGTHAYIYALIVICIAAAAHQAWSANIFTTVSDLFPKKAVGSITGIGGLAGGIGGVLMQLLAGWLTDAFKYNPQTAYLILFLLCAFAYIIAWAIMKVLVPKFASIINI
ncbi:MAG: MFS transporter [Bacteroidota bacterium]|nr:MFS transporter [Bacteroidota bacterium]